MTDEIVVVDNGQTYESTESAIIAKEEADRAKLWAKESERQAGLAAGSSETAVEARDDAIAAKEYAEAAITDTNLITVATDLSATPSNIKTVATNISNVNSVATNISNVNAVAGNATNINAVNANKANIDAVAGNATNINAVAGNSSNINAVNANKTNIDTVAGNSANITTVAGDINRVNLVADDIASVHTVAVDISNVIDVADNKTNIDTVAGNISNVNTVAGISSNVSTVAGIASDVTAVKNNASNITAVAGDLNNINAVAADLTNIDNASTYANNANVWAEGTDEQVQALGGVHSARGWADVSSQGQIQSDYTQTDNTKKDYIKNKPTSGTGISLANNQISIDADTTPTSGSEKPITSGGIFTALSSKADTNLSNTTLGSFYNLVSTNAFDFFAPDARFIEAKWANTSYKGMSYFQMGVNNYSNVFSKTTFNIKPCSIRVVYNGSNVWFNNYTVREIDPVEYLDTGSALTNGKDYYIFVKATSETSFTFVVSLSDTEPTNCRLIGGFHTECANCGSLTRTIATGYSAGNIIPNSIWCLGFRPFGKTNGAAYIDVADKWGHIYLQSGTGVNTTSAYGATITDTRYYGNHCLDMFKIGYELPTDNEFTLMAFGSNEKTNISGSADPVTTGGHVDTANRRMISAYFLEDCCGALWQWLNSEGGSGATGWKTINLDNDTSGSTYGDIYTLLGGGSWPNSADCGSGSRAGNAPRSALSDARSARGVSHNVKKNCDYLE